MKLTDKQDAFCREYLIDLNATQAAIRAGYSSDTARQIASENLSKPNIQEAIAALMAARAEKVGIDAEWVLTRLVEEANADLADLYDENGTLRPVQEWPIIWRKGLISGMEIEELFDGRGEDREHIGRIRKIRLSDRIKRVELIGKHVNVQAFRENHNVSGSGLEGLAERLERAHRRVNEHDRANGRPPRYEASEAD